MSAPLDASQIDRFYAAAALGLGALEARSPVARRFGPDADARWNAFRGGLQSWHRLDLLVRDAAVRNPAGFAPRVIFDLPALADDEPYGPDWPGCRPGEAPGLLQVAVSGAQDPAGALAAAASAWKLAPAPMSATATSGIQPATRLLIAGAGAVLAAAAAFTGKPELDLADQAVLVADDPGTRQLFGLALALLDTRRPPRLARTTATAEELRPVGMTAVDCLLVSDDLSPDARERLSALAVAVEVHS